jgi:hypothetical protein
MVIGAGFLCCSLRSFLAGGSDLLPHCFADALRVGFRRVGFLWQKYKRTRGEK